MIYPFVFHGFLWATGFSRGLFPYGFPLWGKLSPQVTDEGVLAGHLPLTRPACR